MHTDDNYELVWARLLKLHDEFALGEPTMSQKMNSKETSLSSTSTELWYGNDLPYLIVQIHTTHMWWVYLQCHEYFFTSKFERKGFNMKLGVVCPVGVSVCPVGVSVCGVVCPSACWDTQSMPVKILPAATSLQTVMMISTNEKSLQVKMSLSNL